jgi:hypothetical protein
MTIFTNIFSELTVFRSTSSGGMKKQRLHTTKTLQNRKEKDCATIKQKTARERQKD